MTRLVIAIFITAAIVALISKCRRYPDLGAHAARCPDKCDPRLDELFTVDSLAAAMGKAWPGHIEGSGSSGNQYTVPPPETKYWVKDPCLPSEHLAAAIIKAARKASDDQ